MSFTRSKMEEVAELRRVREEQRKAAEHKQDKLK